MTDRARYVKIVEWSDEDEAFVGQCPGVIGPCCHGMDEIEVYKRLCEIVAEWLEVARYEGRPLPPATAGRHVAELIDWHKTSSVQLPKHATDEVYRAQSPI